MIEEENILSLKDFDEEDIDCLLELDTSNDTLEEFLEDTELSEEVIELKSELETRRNTYIDFYESDVKDVIKDFIDENNLPGTLSYEARIKKDCSVKNSLSRKGIEVDDLKDYLGIRFITDNKENAYTVAGLFMMNHCIPRGKEEEYKTEGNRFNAYETRDYFKRPKLDENGNVQYSGIHIFLEKDGMKFEMQIHDLESYLNANLTHDEYKTRKTTERTTVELEIEELIDMEM